MMIVLHNIHVFPSSFLFSLKIYRYDIDSSSANLADHVRQIFFFFIFGGGGCLEVGGGEFVDWGEGMQIFHWLIMIALASRHN